MKRGGGEQNRTKAQSDKGMETNFYLIRYAIQREICTELQSIYVCGSVCIDTAAHNSMSMANIIDCIVKETNYTMTTTRSVTSSEEVAECEFYRPRRPNKFD